MRADVTTPGEQQRPPGAAFYAYNAALAIASPLLLGWYAWRVLGSGKSREGWAERLGLAPTEMNGVEPANNVWVHAVSVGEVVAAAPVVRAYSELPDAFPLEISTITSTGRQMAAKVLPDVPRLFLPVDLLPSVHAVMSRVRPLCLALCEKELWPNLLHEAKRCGVRVALINGTVSDRTVEKALRVGWVYRWALGNIDRFLMQSEEDAARIVRLGADERRVEVAGNTKFDEADEPMSAEDREKMVESLGIKPSSSVFVAGSTNPGEDEVVLDALRHARSLVPELILLIAPRQIERADDICRMATARGLTAIKRTDIAGAHNADVVVLNTFGELARAYSAARVAFVGGTFINKGGHNILQPLAQGVPVVFGPFDQNIRDVGSKAIKAGVAYRVETADRLTEAVGELAMGLAGDELRQRALGFIQGSRGASARCAQALQELALDARGR